MTDTDEAVERAAEAMYRRTAMTHRSGQDWTKVPPAIRRDYRDDARAALAAADGGEVERPQERKVRDENLRLYAENERLRAVADAAERTLMVHVISQEHDDARVELSHALAALHADKEEE